VYTRQ